MPAGCNPGITATHGNAEGIRSDDFKPERARLVNDAIEGAAVCTRDGLGRDEDPLKERIDVALARERDADLVQLLEPAEKIF